MWEAFHDPKDGKVKLDGDNVVEFPKLPEFWVFVHTYRCGLSPGAPVFFRDGKQSRDAPRRNLLDVLLRHTQKLGIFFQSLAIGSGGHPSDQPRRSLDLVGLCS